MKSKQKASREDLSVIDDIIEQAEKTDVKDSRLIINLRKDKMQE